MCKTKYFYYSIRIPAPLMVIWRPSVHATWGVFNIFSQPRQRYTTGTMNYITSIGDIFFLL
jgi:hypothetical protein